VVLLDEPLTVIDPHVKWLLRRKLKQVHAQLKVTLIYVTHDQVEALTFADRVVVMEAGAVLQVGTPEELHASPEHTFVGHFIGSPGMNLVPCEPTTTAVRVAGAEIVLEPERMRALHAALATPAATVAAGPRCTLGFRPDVAAVVADAADGTVEMALRSVQPMGTHTLLGAEFGGRSVWLRAPAEARPPGPCLRVRLPAESLVLFVDDRRIAAGGSR
jgi:glycerol transport system ATP-binding protein